MSASGLPPASEDTLAFYEKAAATYSDRWNDPALMAAQRARVMETTGPPAELLDLGCGTGRDVLAFASAGYQVTGLDLSPAMLAEARDLSAAANLAASPAFVCGDLRALPFPAGSFQVVWMTASLLHLPRSDARPALREARRVSRRDGIFYVSVKDIAASGGVSEGVDPAGRFYSYWDAAGFSADVAAAGFEVSAAWPSVTGGVPWLNILAS